MTTMASMTAADSVYIDCPGSGITLDGTIRAGKVYFHGFIKGGVLSMPVATQVFVDNTNNSGPRDSAAAVTLNNNTGFCVRASACTPTTPSAGQCSSLPTGNTGSKAQLFIRRGMLSGNGTSSLLRLCNTEVIMQGGDLGDGSSGMPGGCLPATTGSAPKTTPCSGAAATAGDGSISTNGVADWTAPNAYGDMTAAGYSLTQKQAFWDGGEDLALWTESYGTGSVYKMAGGGKMH